MSKLFLTLILCIHLMAPLAAHAQTVIKTPISYSLQEYGFVLATALLGGLASWYMKVRKGELLAWNLSALIGELCVSAFAGLLAFWVCEALGVQPLVTAAVIGVSGHAGARGIAWLESLGQKFVEKKLGIEPKE
jgi:hypothetical protein